MSVAFALILGVLVGAGMTVKLYWIKLKNKLSRKTTVMLPGSIYA